VPWNIGEQKPLHEDTRDLYYVRDDFSLANNLASENPAKLEKMKNLFMTEAARYNVLPLDDRVGERINPATRQPDTHCSGHLLRVR
jgi:arylsulfatase A-like enzyme